MSTVSYLSWEAKYPGVCEDCGERFVVGTRVRWVNIEEHTVAHLKCPDDGVELTSGHKKDACPQCHTIHRGECW